MLQTSPNPERSLVPLMNPWTLRKLELSNADISRLARLESESWDHALRADTQMIRKRLSMGHQAIVAEKGDRFIAAVCYYHTSHEPGDFRGFPRSFQSFASMSASAPVRSTYVYSLCVTPQERGRGSVQAVVDCVVADARAVGAKVIVGDGRCAAYAGSEHGPDRVRHDPVFQQAIDSWHRTGVRPETSLLIRDPLLRYHHRRNGCELVHLAPDFLPEDLASGGFRVIFVKHLVDR